jgi:hypothetical protein
LFPAFQDLMISFRVNCRMAGHLLVPHAELARSDESEGWSANSPLSAEQTAVKLIDVGLDPISGHWFWTIAPPQNRQL